MNLQRKHLFEKIKEEKLHKEGQLRIKKIKSGQKEEILNLEPLTLSNMQNSVMELILHRRLLHENIYRQKQIKLDSRRLIAELNYDSSEYLMNLDSLIPGGYLQMNHLKFIMYQLFSVVNYLHFNGLVARNICPENIMLSKSVNLMLDDFSGMRLESVCNRNSREHKLNINYAAPELSLNLNKNFFASDIWSLGCILFELAEKRPLFRVNHSMDLLRCIFQCLGTPKEEYELEFISSKGTKKWIQEQKFSTKKTVSTWMSHNASNLHLKDLLDKCVKLNPLQRITAAEALEHPFFSELYDPEEENQFLQNHLSFSDFSEIFSKKANKQSLKSILFYEFRK